MKCVHPTFERDIRREESEVVTMLSIERDAATTPAAKTTGVANCVQNISDSKAPNVEHEDWRCSFAGAGARPFEQRVINILMAPIALEDIEITRDGDVFLPKAKYLLTLNRAFGPGGWAIVPRTEAHVTRRHGTCEYGFICLNRLVSVCWGEMVYHDPANLATAMEACKWNALLRCCKNLSIASELEDPVFIHKFKRDYCELKFSGWARRDRTEQ